MTRILLTVGTQLPFDRLARAMDGWAQENAGANIVGQLGRLAGGAYRPRHFRWSEFMAPQEFEREVAEADIVVSHAGIGSIISARLHGIPIVIMPRQAILEEHRNDHQMSTAREFADREGIHVVHDADELADTLATLSASAQNCEHDRMSRFADPGLIEAIREFAFRAPG